MITSFIQTKGGTGKTTLAKCLAFSKTFKKEFGSVCLIELDPQGTISSWHKHRQESRTVRRECNLCRPFKSKS